MRYIAFITLTLIGFARLALAADTPPAPPVTLTLQDLVNRPDRWPPAITLPHDFKFSNGAVAHQGDKVRVLHFDGSTLMLGSASNIRFQADPADCGLLDAANQVWTAMTPAQRAIDPASLAADLSLWPVRIKTVVPIKCSFGNLPSGADVALVTVTATATDIAWPNSQNRLNLTFDTTDIFDAARQLVLIDPDKRPSRIAAALAPIMVGADGKPYRDDHLQDHKIFALYFGAGWCPPCLVFSPDFVTFLNGALPTHPELAAVLLSNDKTTADMLAYLKDEKMPIPGVPTNAWIQSSILNKYSAEIIPQLIIIDRFGRVLAGNDDHHGNRGDPKDTVTILGQLLATPATQP